MKNLLVISIRPEYMKLILAGEKSIELRKCKPSLPKDDILVALYCTAPVKAVVGFCLLDELIEDSPSSLWGRFSELVGVDKKTYQDYYNNNSKAVGLKLDSVYQLEKELSLDKIREEVPNFAPPQTYKYYNLNFLIKRFKESLLDEYHNLVSVYNSREL
ncbi:MAG: ASCH domain-containing protein [Bacteroidota bacterium]